MPRCRARDLSILVHGRDPRHGGQKKEKKNIGPIHCVRASACVSVNMACVCILERV